MAQSQNAPATDSAAELNDIIGSDSTATFEDDPKFIKSDPAATGSSENLNAAKADPEEGDDEDDEDGDFDEDDGEDDEEETDEEDAGTDEEDEDDEDDEYDDDDDDEEEVEDEEDDAEEVSASSRAGTDTLRADGLLGYEDEADDVQNGLSEKQGNAERAKQEAALKDGEDDDAGDDGREAAVDEDSLNAEENIDLDGDESALDSDETATVRKGLLMAATPGSAGAHLSA